ncbi:CcoQ/FixQ family Cbb3-type cytochrome c oxidase assembly chaperone [beta proteobacterium MWH-UniP1]
MTIASFHSVLTLVGVVAFIVMVIWVFGKKQKASMDRHAMIPLQDDEPIKHDTH